MYGPSSRKDDLTCLCYVLIFLKTMDLPWHDYLYCMPCSSFEKTFDLVLKRKQQYTLISLAQRYEMPQEFIDVAAYVDNMEDQQYPNYQLIYNKL